MLHNTSSLIFRMFGHDSCRLLKYAIFCYALVNTDATSFHLQYVVQVEMHPRSLNQCEVVLPEAEGFFPSSCTFNNKSNAKLTAKYLEINTFKNQSNCHMSTLQAIALQEVILTTKQNRISLLSCNTLVQPFTIVSHSLRFQLFYPQSLLPLINKDTKANYMLC